MSGRCVRLRADQLAKRDAGIRKMLEDDTYSTAYIAKSWNVGKGVVHKIVKQMREK